MIRIKESRREQLLSEIEEILRSKILLPGHASKLKGKLMFGASQLYGKSGRAALRALSERQYDSNGNHKTNEAIEESLKIWKKVSCTRIWTKL